MCDCIKTIKEKIERATGRTIAQIEPFYGSFDTDNNGNTGSWPLSGVPIGSTENEAFYGSVEYTVQDTFTTIIDFASFDRNKGIWSTVAVTVSGQGNYPVCRWEHLLIQAIFPAGGWITLDGYRIRFAT
jgi:hypothetical protein